MARINNSINLVGRIVTPIETRTVGDAHLASFVVAVDRPKTKSGDVVTDFIRCKAWNYTAEFIVKYFDKGRKIALQGELNIDTQEMDDGSKRNYASVRVDSVDFADSKSNAEKENEFAAAAPKKVAQKKRPAIAVVEDDENRPW